jgi:DNA polymerase-3 subunit gamma/tau
MSYQVLARKWRPRRFDDVVGQHGITRTLAHAIASDRLAQAFVFAGPRGVGKTTTARILACALNCEQGPTPEPCGVCDACREIADSRDMDVLEIDAATHTQVDNVRDVIISGLAVPPARDRRKIFIIDEVHQLSRHSFAALLKSVEEPPPHVVFIMATTELAKIPETILSRSQVYEFRTIAEAEIAGQLRRIAEAEKVDAAPGALALIARAADGSMRDALTALDQVLAFAGERVSEEDVAAALGIVGRDLLLDILEAVAAENAPAAFDLADRAIETGYDLRLLCRDLSRLVRDLMLISVDAARIGDTAIVPEGERERVAALSAKFSREDLLRSFDLIARTEYELRQAAEPRHHLEMALLKWIHLRKLMPLADLIERLQQGGALPAVKLPPAAAAGGSATTGAKRSFPPAPQAPSAPAAPAKPAVPAKSASPSTSGARGGVSAARGGAATPLKPAAPVGQDVPSTAERHVPVRKPSVQAEPAGDGVFEADAEDGSDEASELALPRAAGAAPAVERAVAGGEGRAAPAAAGAGEVLVHAFVAEVRRAKESFYKMYLSLAHRVDADGDRIVFVFAPARRAARDAVEKARGWLEPLAARVAGRRMTVTAALAEAASSEAGPSRAGGGAEAEATGQPGRGDLEARARSDPGMQTLLDLMPLDIKSVEKI